MAFVIPDNENSDSVTFFVRPDFWINHGLKKQIIESTDKKKKKEKN